MKAVYVSDDGRKTGTEDEVAAYEARLANPLSRMRFPYTTVAIFDSNQNRMIHPWREKFPTEEQMYAIIAFANLAPLIAKLAEPVVRYKVDRDSLTPELKELLDAYDEACALIPKTGGES